ncbi:MAG: sigma-54-dependent Fis family transcriptional regulator [Alphaproteobacteria bacterium CG11_big_fil_rev_8_21_14_0_20_39_49]|nr:MAG: sigma-54-dependent Fis family transcriptional regulator [Alphaproteobacteria bacterium CG11_big_fil_rev_8_21_14_0_20_39_49]
MSIDVLVVDDEEDIRDLISDILKDDGFSPRVANDSKTAIEAVKERVPAAIVLDIWLQGSELDGLGILETVKSKYPNLPVIMISGHGNIETAINSIKLGAYDYIEKPFKEDRLLRLVKRAIETAKLKDENAQLKIRGGIENHLIGKSPAVTALKNAIDRVAPAESRIMIKGPAGCGKEVVARIIHQKSKRKNGPFVILNAASISPQRVEEELFGKEDATGIGLGENRKIGTFEKAHGGTLFLDEIADMPLAVQGKILRILQESSFERLGGNRLVKVDVRVISSTNKDLQKEIEKGRFREDLFYRLNVVPLNVPALAERSGDLRPLCEYFVKRCADTLGVVPRKISENAMAAMEVYDWPGNVRQLRNIIEWLLIMAPEDPNEPITSSMLPPEILQNTPMSDSSGLSKDILGLPLRAAREVFEKQYLSSQLKRFGGNVSRTANFVGMERSAFHRKIKSLNVHGHIEEEQEETSEA